ncbi:polysaccharide export protein [Thioalkalivibrio sp. ALMg13-2]|uniref:polysaccharide export protein n=1 Tax=Thioalkalivibrio sp. ALMg13-2 TaxID=1158167 RepID=UPI0003641281|nr:polysaccharide export protein [Thioalkalivibrio sp. ALMg13-2]
MMQFRKVATVMLAMTSLAALAGCAHAPGAHIGERTDAPPIDELVDIKPITLDLIRTQARLTVEPGLRRASETLEDEVDQYNYRIGRGDILSIIVYEHPELTIPAGAERSAAESGNLVHSDGSIFYPFVGRVRVEGLTVSEVRDIVARELAAYVTRPQVEVRVAQFNSQKVQVTGEVREPGRQPITQIPLTLLDAIGEAGGLTEDANWHDARLTRDGEDIRLSVYDMLARGELAQNRLLRDGDVLHIPDTAGQQVFVMGEVGAPQRLALGRGPMTLVDALTEAGSFQEARADASGIFVIRQATPESEKLATVYQLDARHAASLMLGVEFELEPLDIVYVTTTPLGRWNRLINQLLPSAIAIQQTTRTTRDLRNLSDDF